MNRNSDLAVRGNLVAAAAILLLSSSLPVWAQPHIGVLPGDEGKPPPGLYDGIPPTDPNFRPPPGLPRPIPAARGPGIELALVAAKAVVAGCKQFPLAVAVVDSMGFPILTYVPDGSRRAHSYTALRKAYSATVFKAPTVEQGPKAQQDAALAAKIRADANLIAFGGGVPLMVGNEVVGAIGVGGAEPGGHDNECALIGVAAIKDQLK